MSKYAPLWKWIVDNKNKEIKLSFDEIKDIIGFDIDHSFLTYKRELKEWGYEVEKVSLKEKYVRFKKM